MERNILIFFLGFIASAYAVCPTDWVETSDSCWFASSVETNWPDASSVCQAFHGELAVIQTPETWNNVKSLIGGGRGDRYWIDGTDFIVEGDWLWASVDTNNKIDTNAVGVNMIEGNDQDADCLMIDKNGGNKWIAETCDEDAFFICQHKKVNSQPPVVG